MACKQAERQKASVSSVKSPKGEPKATSSESVKSTHVTEAKTGVTRAPSDGDQPTVPTISESHHGTVHAGRRVYHINSKKPDYRYTLDRDKAYLGSCALHHSFFVREYLRNLYRSKTTMNTSCNAGQTETSTRGWYQDFHVWLNEQGIVNLVSIPELEECGHKVEAHTDRNWVVTSPQGRRITFKRDTGGCNRMPCTNLWESGEDSLAMIAAVRKNFESFTRKQVEKALESRILHRRVGHPSEQTV